MILRWLCCKILRWLYSFRYVRKSLGGKWVLVSESGKYYWSEGLRHYLHETRNIVGYEDWGE